MRLPQDRILHIDTELAGDEVRVVAEWQGELVRCKDCEWYKDFDGCFFSTARCEPEHFCSYGKRREL